jgi:hypothetical protein
MKGGSKIDFSVVVLVVDQALIRQVEKVRRSLEVAERKEGGMSEILIRRSIRYPPSAVVTSERSSWCFGALFTLTWPLSRTSVAI